MTHVTPNSRVTLHYRIQCGRAEVVNTFDDAPETIVLDSGAMDPRLEFLLKGLTAGQHESFALDAWQAFGEHKPELVQRMSRSDLAGFEPLKTGQTIRFDLPNGTSLNGEILTLDSEHIEIDFNHPLAGYPITFEVEILTVEPSHA